MEKKATLYPFIQKLYSMLGDPNNAAYIAWNDAGDQFTVYSPAEFSSQLLPQQFKHNNFCSFIRQLNIYGFHKVESDNWVFIHEDGHFQRGRLDLLGKITRRKQQKRSPPSDTENEKPAKVAKMTAESTPSGLAPLTPNPSAPSTHIALSPLPSTPQPFQVPGTNYSPLNLSHSSPSSISSPQPYTDILLKMNESIVGELNNVKRKSQTQDNTIAWLIQELLKSKKEIEELKRSVKTLQVTSEDVQRNKVLEHVQNQQQHQRQLHLQLQQQLQTQPTMLSPSPFGQSPLIKSEVPNLDQLRLQQQQLLQQQAGLQRQAIPNNLTQHPLQASTFDLGVYLANAQAAVNNGEASSDSSSDDGLAVLENVYDGPDWIQMTQAH